MLRNLFCRYGENFSSPRTKDFVFYTKDESDFLYKKGENAVIYCASTMRTISLRWKLYKNLFTTELDSGVASESMDFNWKINIDTKNLKPGFYDLRIEADMGNGGMLQQKCTFGYDIESFPCPDYKPEDFDAFWEESLKKLDSIPLDVKESEYIAFNNEQINDYNVMQASLTNNYDEEGCIFEKVVSNEISFSSAGGIRINGYVAKPEGNGKYPAMLILPGAGYAGRPRPLEHARHGYLALDIQVHGQSLSENHAPSEESVKYGDISLGKDYYYNNIYLHCVQAINYLCSREDVDKTKIVVVGGSQGGRLSLVTAALDNRVTDVVAGIVHYSNLPYIHYSKKSNEQKYNGCNESVAKCDEPISKFEAFYDVMNFASRIKCRVLINGGLIDEVSPPEGVVGVYRNLVTDDKEMVLLANLAHDWSVGFDKYAWKWLKKK